MKPDLVEQELRELAWRRPLGEAEQARLGDWLARHPEARAEWEADAALGAALARLPRQPAPSNLTARVLTAIDREDLTAAGVWKTRWWGSMRWVPRAAVTVVILAGGVLWHQYHQRAVEQTKDLATLATLTEGGEMPSAEVLENFEVILKIHPAPLADTELLSMSKQLADFKP
jgi:hypothetical protein